MKNFEHLLFNNDNSKRILHAPAFFTDLNNKVTKPNLHKTFFNHSFIPACLPLENFPHFWQGMTG
jgi:hypothetical protein